MNVKKTAMASVMTAMGVVCSTFYVPVGTAKVFPIQHLINVLGGVLLGPWYALMIAVATSLLRNLLGTGSILAFPGSMIGAVFAGLAFRYSQKITLAVLGEVLGTGILGALAAYPLALLFLGSKGAATMFVIPFAISSLAGAALAYLVLGVLKRTGVLIRFRENLQS